MPVYKDPSPHRKIYTDHDIAFFVSLVPPPALLIPAGGGINFRPPHRGVRVLAMVPHATCLIPVACGINSRPPSRAGIGGAPGTRTQHPGLKRPLLCLMS